MWFPIQSGHGIADKQGHLPIQLYSFWSYYMRFTELGLPGNKNVLSKWQHQTHNWMKLIIPGPKHPRSL